MAAINPALVSAALRSAMTLIAAEARWTRKTMASDAGRACCEPEAAEACRWCTLGALFAVTKPGSIRRLAADHLGDAASALYGCDSVVEANDTYLHADVLALYAHAIAQADRATVH